MPSFVTRSSGCRTIRFIRGLEGRTKSGSYFCPGAKQGFGLLDRDAILREATQPCRYFIFGYGSLVNSTSREHVVGKCEVLAASLLGYERRWHAVEHIRLLEVEPPQVRPALFLDVALSKDGVCNGVLIPIDKAARFRDMDRREKNYVRIDVTQWIQPRSRELPPAARVYTYVGRPQFALPPYGTFNPTATPTEPGDAVGELCVPGDYLRLIEDGLKEWDDAFVRQFRDNTRTRPDVPVVEGRYQFLNPEQNLTTGR